MADCFDVGLDANKNRLNEQSVMDIVTDLQRLKDPNKAANSLANVEDQIFARGTYLVEGVKLANKVEKRNRYLNIVRESQLLNLAEAADQQLGDPSLGLESALVGTNAIFEGSKRSVDALDAGIFNSVAGGFIADLQSSSLMRRFNNMRGDFEREVSKVLSNLNKREPETDLKVSSDAKRLGEIMFKYQRAALERENKAGSFIRLKEGRVVQSSHEPAKLAKAGYDEWSSFIRGKLDFERMDIEDGEIDKFLQSSFTAIKSGVRKNQVTDDIAQAFKGPQNLAKRQSASGVFTFKNSDDWYDYDQKFGGASLREAFMQDLRSSSRATALMDILGTNPEAMVERVQLKLQQKYRGDEKKLAGLQRKGNFLNFESALAEVTGGVNIGADTKAAKILSGYRSLQTMAKLGAAFIPAVTDIAYIATNRMYQGRSMLQAWGDGFSAIFKSMPPKEMRDFADRLGVGLEGQLGDFMNRFNASDDLPGKTSKMMGLFFKLNLLQPWSESNKRGVTLMIANDLGREANKKFGQLPQDLQRLLPQYGINKEAWEVARQGVTNGPDGRPYLVPGEVADTAVKDNLFAMLSSEADFAIPTPGARERAILRRGYRPGTTAGEAIRFVTQFKSFSAVAMTKVLGRQVYGSGSKTLSQQLKRGVGANIGLVNAIVGTSFLGYFAMQAKEVLKGREPRPASPETFIAAMLQGGGLGIYGDFLFGEANRYGGGLAETLVGPGPTAVLDLVQLVQKTRGVAFGADENLKGDFVKLFKENTPLTNLFYTQQATNYLIWYQLQELTNPGYLRRMENRIEKQNNADFWLKPSSIVATGGGFR